MKKIILFGALLLVNTSLLSIVACSDDDAKTPAKPVITLTEVGHENSRHVTAGEDLHLKGTIVAEGLIRRIDVEIHLEEGGDFEIEESYTEGKYVGVREAAFHEHIPIPTDAPAGEYHLHFTVTDQEGQATTVEAEIDVEAATATP
ncbi:MAG: DUF4625 domain-containing protein [Prevotellaceae bacterium]|jgi:uncharacterized membrane protein|nr:DUF4625 domain-containing protein [Prevotellaceae bacterium]